jgi:hypothetical protein
MNLGSLCESTYTVAEELATSELPCEEYQKRPSVLKNFSFYVKVHTVGASGHGL